MLLLKRGLRGDCELCWMSFDEDVAPDPGWKSMLLDTVRAEGKWIRNFSRSSNYSPLVSKIRERFLNNALSLSTLTAKLVRS